MQRRDVLRSGPGLATVATVGLAGCFGNDEEAPEGDGGDVSTSTDCGTPGDDIASALPEDDRFEQVGEVVRHNAGGFGPRIDSEGSVSTRYSGPNEEPVTATVVELSSTDDAERLRSRYESDPLTVGRLRYWGYIFSDRYLFWAFADEEATVRAALEAMEPLEGCVPSAVTVVELQRQLNRETSTPSAGTPTGPERRPDPPYPDHE